MEISKKGKEVGVCGGRKGTLYFCKSMFGLEVS